VVTATILSHSYAWGQTEELPSVKSFSSHRKSADFNSISSAIQSLKIFDDFDSITNEYLADEVQSQLIDLYAQGRNLGIKLEAELGKEVLKQKIDANYIDPVVSDMGEAELNTIDGERFIRVKHNLTDLSFVFLSSDKISPKSKHLRQLIARQHIATNRNKHGNPKGRDVVLVWYQGEPELGMSSIKKVQYAPRYLKFSPRWWVDYGKTIGKTPINGDYIFGVIMGVLQGGVTYGFELSKVGLGLGADINMYPVALSAGFGFFIGSFISTYLNWKHLSSFRRNAAKSALISILFNVFLIASKEKYTGSGSPLLIEDGALQIHYKGLINDFWILVATYFHNLSKIEWERIPQIRRDERISTNLIRVGIPKKLLERINDRLAMIEAYVETPSDLGEAKANYAVRATRGVRKLLNMEAFMKQASVENQSGYMLAFTLRNAFFYFPFLGKGAFIGSIPLVKGINLGYSEAVGYEHHDKIEAEWEGLWKHFPTFRKALRPCGGLLRQVGRGIARITTPSRIKH
jgi:hypothetical protein